VRSNPYKLCSCDLFYDCRDIIYEGRFQSTSIADIHSAFGSFLFGYDSGIIGSVISGSYVHFHDYFDAPGAPVIGAIVSLFAAGAFFGALMAGWTADKYGRKRTIQIGSVIAIVGCTLQTAAVNVGMLIAGRFIAGWSIGVLSMIVPMYQAEISPPHARGLLSGWTQLMIGKSSSPVRRDQWLTY
jgi:MFS family permease